MSGGALWNKGGFAAERRKSEQMAVHSNGRLFTKFEAAPGNCELNQMTIDLSDDICLVETFDILMWLTWTIRS